MDVKKQYDKLLGDLLGVLDAVDQACLHWQEVEAEMSASVSSASVPDILVAETVAVETSVAGDGTVHASQTNPSSSLSPFQQVAKAVLRNLEVLLGLDDKPAEHPSQSVDAEANLESVEVLDVDTSELPASDNLTEVIASGREGAELIQRSLLDALRQHQITPIPAQGKPFNPKTMFAIGREPDATVPNNTVLEEIVRGYQQGDKILREAQVIVSSQ